MGEMRWMGWEGRIVQCGGRGDAGNEYTGKRICLEGGACREAVEEGSDEGSEVKLDEMGALPEGLFGTVPSVAWYIATLNHTVPPRQLRF